MCGFCGITKKDENALKKMALSLKDRAIDADTYYYNTDVSLYHAHLKISDLDKDTSQPFVYKNLVISFVGEIYNKEYLLKYIDHINLEETELATIALLFEKLGAKFVNLINGEFAIFIYDLSTHTHYLFRDRWGVKTLYYTIKNGILSFSSEIKSLMYEQDAKISKDGMLDYVIFQYLISPHTLIDGVFSLEPGNYIIFQNGVLKTEKFAPYISQVNDIDLIDCLIQNTIRRIPTYLDKVFISLSGGPDSNFILHTVKNNFRGETIAYSLVTKDNHKEIEIAQKNTKKMGIEHLIIDMDTYNHEEKLEENMFVHEGLVYCPNILKIVKDAFPQHKDVKVDFSGDGKEEVFLTNRQFLYERTLQHYKYFKSKGVVCEYPITHEFLNVTLFDFNLRLIDKVTLRNGVERRVPYTDYELFKYREEKEYKPKMVKYLQENGIKVIEGEWGFFLGLKFKPFDQNELVSKANIFLSKVSSFYANNNGV